MDRMATGQAPVRRNSAQIADKLRAVPGLLSGAETKEGRHATAAGSCREIRAFERSAARRIAATKNAPSRWRLRPTFRLTTAEATAYRRAINLGRSVLGARQTLGGSRGPVKTPEPQLVANCVLFFSQWPCCATKPVLWIGEARKNGRTRGSDRKSSPSRERFRPPSRRTFRFRVVLLGGLRPTGAPCSAQTETYGTGPVRSRGPDGETCRYLRAVSVNCHPTATRSASGICAIGNSALADFRSCAGN
jgi:hypothetical protein